MNTNLPAPIYNAYWLCPNKVLLGSYLADDVEPLKLKVRNLLKMGVTYYANMTNEGEYGRKPYHLLLQEEAEKQNIQVVHQRFAITDFDIPVVDRMKHILDCIDAAIAVKHKVYIHCMAGLGRTGTVAGCYLVRHGMTGEEALAEIKQRKQNSIFARMDSPITVQQKQMVLDWKIGA
ncbi:protein-tyrosine phosphatase family protein [Beggiatoa leptomitoformis]|nr:dual specificity protein phosphatase family protein [Beggiatoa leptomitoformis]